MILVKEPRSTEINGETINHIFHYYKCEDSGEQFTTTELDTLNMSQMGLDELSVLKKHLEPYKNTLVINELNRVVRLVDVIETEIDFYWVYDTTKGFVQDSCVGSWIPLKGFLRDNDYKKLVYEWNLNHMEKAI